MRRKSAFKLFIQMKIHWVNHLEKRISISRTRSACSGGESHSGKERQTSKRWRRGAGVAGKRRGDSDRERRRVRWQSGERGWEAEGWAAPLMPIWPGDVIKLTYWFLWIYECLFHELHFQSRGLFRALSFFPQMDQLCAHVILLPEEPTHTSPICGASPGRTDSHYEHINKLTFFFFFPLHCLCVCPQPPLSPLFSPNISDCFLPPWCRRVSLSRRALGSFLCFCCLKL